jgi:hypothetical protein
VPRGHGRDAVLAAELIRTDGPTLLDGWATSGLTALLDRATLATGTFR